MIRHHWSVGRRLSGALAAAALSAAAVALAGCGAASGLSAEEAEALRSTVASRSGLHVETAARPGRRFYLDDDSGPDTSSTRAIGQCV